MNKETQKPELEMSSSDSTMDIVFKNIYTSCDPRNLNLVPTSDIIEFVRPYMMEDLSALEILRTMLDPENKNVDVDGEHFYNVMTEWAAKIASHGEEDSEGEFNRTPSQINPMDDKVLPYTQSTPRASFGQKLLSCQDLLNLSNVSNYNVSPSKQTKDNSLVGQEREEEVKQLRYELNKVLGENSMLKIQLAYSEEQNECLHDEVKKYKTRLQSEHHVNDNVQENKSCIDDMKEDIQMGKRRIEELNKKLVSLEKENSHLNIYVKKLEKESLELEDRRAQSERIEQTLRKQIADLKNELDVKELDLSTLTKISEDLKLKLYEKNNELDQLLNENELLDYKKQGLEKIITSRRFSLSSHYNTCIDEMSSYFQGNTIPIYSSPLKRKSIGYDNSPSINKIVSPISLNPVDPKSKMFYKVLRSSTPKGTNGLGVRKASSLNIMSTRSLPNIFNLERCAVVQDQSGDSEVWLNSVPHEVEYINGPFESLQTELFQVDPQFDHKDKNEDNLEYEEQVNALKLENESLQEKLQILEKENNILSAKLASSNEKIVDLDKRLNTILLEKKSFENSVTKLEEYKTEANNLLKDLETKLAHLKDENNRLKSDISIKDSEIKNKFNFESACKNLEIEYGHKITQLENLQQIYEDDKNDLKVKLEHLKNENNRLKSAISIKESEIKNRFHFESAYKNLEIEYAIKIAKLEDLEQMCEDDKNAIKNLTNTNRDLEKSLMQTKAELLKTKELIKNRRTLSQNIEQTANKVQNHIECKNALLNELQILNKEFKSKTDKLENELEDKTRLLAHLKGILKKDEEIKNKLWNDNHDLTSSLNILTGDYQKLLKQMGEQESLKKELKEDYNVLLSQYNQEKDKTKELTFQISSHKKDFEELDLTYQELTEKYNAIISKNFECREEISNLKSGLESIKDSHKMYKGELTKSLAEYQNALQQLGSKLKDLEFENKVLTTDLNIEKEKYAKELSQEKIKSKSEHNEHKSENGIIDDNKKLSDGDANSDLTQTPVCSEKSVFSIKNRSFEKQQLTIDRLREKIENLNKALLHEKSRNDMLNERLSCKDEELRVANKNIISEKNNSLTIISSLKEQLERQEDFYKQMCNDSNVKIQNLSTTLSNLDILHQKNLFNLSQKDSLLQRHFEMNEYHKLTMEKLSKCIKDIQQQNTILTQDLNAKEISLKDVTVENQNLKHMTTRLENQRQELSLKLSYQEVALSSCQSDLSKRNEELTALSSLLSNREERIHDLTTDVKEYEQKLSQIVIEASQKDNEYAMLEEELKTIHSQLSSTDVSEAKSISDSGSQLDKDLQPDIAQDQVTDSFALEKISDFMTIISECCADLNRAFTRFIESWKIKIESDPTFEQLPTLKLCESLELEHVLSVIVHNIKAVMSWFDILSSNMPSTMEDSTKSLDYHSSKPKTIRRKPLNKFTLRSCKLHLSTVDSPDSRENNDSPDSRETKDSPDSREMGMIHSIDETPDYDSPDSQNIKTFEMNEHGENLDGSSMYTYLPLLTFDLQFKDAFPHITDSVLDKLDLHDNNLKLSLSKEETEELFTTFAIQIELDSKDVKDRLEKQRDVCSNQHRKCLYLLKDISLRLRDHNCIGATDPITPVFVMLEDVRFQVQELVQAVGQFGVLTCENRMTKCWNLVTHYIAIRQNCECAQEQSSPNISPLAETKFPKCLPEQITEKCKNCASQNKNKGDKKAKEYPENRSCLSRLNRTIVYMSFMTLVIFIGVILVHWQCKMTTENKICPLDDFITVLSQRVGTPPY